MNRVEVMVCAAVGSAVVAVGMLDAWRSTALRRRLEVVVTEQRLVASQLRDMRSILLSISALPRAGWVANAALPAELIQIGSAPVKGSPSARAVLIEYGDFECSYCRRFARETAPILDREYVETGLVRRVFCNLPLPIHHGASVGSGAATCAAAQGKFWRLYPILFGTPLPLTPESVTRAARRAGLDNPEFSECVLGPGPESVRREVDEAHRLGITSTPTFLFGEVAENGGVRVMRRISGAQPLPVFKGALEGLPSIAAHRKKTKNGAQASRQ